MALPSAQVSERPLHCCRLAELSGQIRCGRPRRQHRPVLLFHHRIDRERDTRVRQIDDCGDVLLIDPTPRNGGTDVGLVLMIGKHDLGLETPGLLGEILRSHLGSDE